MRKLLLLLLLFPASETSQLLGEPGIPSLPVALPQGSHSPAVLSGTSKAPGVGWVCHCTDHRGHQSPLLCVLTLSRIPLPSWPKDLLAAALKFPT